MGDSNCREWPVDDGDPRNQAPHNARDEYSRLLTTCLEQKEENTMQMVRVLQGRVKALTNFIRLKHQRESINIPTTTHVIKPTNERSEIGAKSSDTDENATKYDQYENKIQLQNFQCLDYAEESDDKFNEDSEGSYIISSLAYRNPRTPHTDAERRIESLIQEYEDESNPNEYVPTKRRSVSRLRAHDIASRHKHRKLIIQSLLSRLESNSSQYLTRASNSITFHVKSEEEIIWPIPISDKEMNPTLLLHVSLQMITHAKTRRNMETLSLHGISQSIFVHSFWLTHVQYFQKLSWREQTYLKTKISQLYPQMIAVVTDSQPPSKRDLFFRTYPLVIAKAIYLALSYLCPGNTLFKGQFERVLFHSIFRLLTSVDICASTVDFLRQSLYRDQEINARVNREAESRTKRGSNKDDPNVDVDGFTDLPRQQQRIAFDSYKISPLLERYLGGDARVHGSLSMMKRTVPTEQCAVGGVDTYRRVSTRFARDSDERDRRSEARKSVHKVAVSEKAKARQTIVALHKEQQNLFLGNRKSRREYVDSLLHKQEQERKLALVTRSSMKSNYPIS